MCVSHGMYLYWRFTQAATALRITFYWAWCCGILWYSPLSWTLWWKFSCAHARHSNANHSTLWRKHLSTGQSEQFPNQDKTHWPKKDKTTVNTDKNSHRMVSHRFRKFHALQLRCFGHLSDSTVVISIRPFETQVTSYFYVDRAGTINF